MTKNIQEVATQNAQIQDLQNQVAELKKQLNETLKANEIYYDIARYGRYEVVDNEDLYECMIVIGVGSYREKIEELNVFAEDRGQRVYLLCAKDCGWLIEYKNTNGIIVTMTPRQLILDSHDYNLLDAFDNLK